VDPLVIQFTGDTALATAQTVLRNIQFRVLGTGISNLPRRNSRFTRRWHRPVQCACIGSSHGEEQQRATGPLRRWFDQLHRKRGSTAGYCWRRESPTPTAQTSMVVS